MKSSILKNVNRRNFLKAQALAGVALGTFRGVHASENNTLKIGIVGCGSRGRGAAANALKADPNTKVVAIADALEERATVTADFLKNEFEDRVQLTPETVFHGLDAYKKVIELSDVVLLCETPHFRPLSLRAAVEAGKHIFCEKPVAVDAPGVRSALESVKIAEEKKINLVSGLCWRYDPNVLDMMKRIHDGQIGDALSVRLNFLTGKVWTRPRNPGDTEMMYQIRNWYNFNWLSGDIIVEQAIHSFDKALWVFRDEPPVRAYGLGGRTLRRGDHASSDIYDSMAVVYEYDDGRAIYSYCNQMNKVFFDRDEYVSGTKGFAKILAGKITGQNPYSQKQVKANRYDLEHVALFNAIRSGNCINDGQYSAQSTLLTILGREVCYTGKKITWDEMLNSEDSLSPKDYSMDADPPTLPDEKGRYLIPLPGAGKEIYEIL